MNDYYFKLFIFIVYAIAWIYGHSNALMFKAVFLSEKLNSDSSAAAQINRENYKSNSNNFKLYFTDIKRWKKNLLSIGCFLGRPKSGRPVETNKVEIFKKI